jgi:hypothetical protein
MPVANGLIKRVAAGKRGIAELFTQEQEEFLMRMAKRHIDFKTLAVLGPVTAQRWRVEDPCCPWPITAELWKREDGDLLMEVSIKAPIRQAAVAVGGFMALLAEVGAERDKDEQAKTRWVLEYYAAKLARNSSRRGAAGKKAAGKTAGTAAGKKAAGRKAAGRKAAGKKAAGKKAAGRKAAGRKTAGRKTAGKKAVGKRSAATKQRMRVAKAAVAKAPRKAAAAKAARKRAGHPATGKTSRKTSKNASRRR